MNVAENRRTHGFRIEASGRASSIDVFPSFAKKEEEKFRVFAGLFFTLLEKGVCASRENQKQQERRSACACLRAWKFVL